MDSTEKPEDVKQDAPVEDYRTPPPPCEVCEAREKAAKEMLPFEKHPECPECKTSDPIMWQVVCQGDGSFLVQAGKRGFWFFKWWRRVEKVTFKCKIENAPKHFHYGCHNCKHRWMMLTATEKKAE